MKEILQERSEALFARTEKLQREEMEERLKEHAERMELMRALVMALSKSAGEIGFEFGFWLWKSDFVFAQYLLLLFRSEMERVLAIKQKVLDDTQRVYDVRGS
ncbi:hypothetical protein PF004_g16044 [Phytophthora fragariae]|uniref:Uncharacterized protein n=1 Tax=Phytophthora fragariae TaxID=53985 RepID=A0A6G0NJM2_9STRA|nr:hypothetical protein PF004_g16044 [Phytophthora fragariae]